MANAILKINHKIVHKWANAVLTPIHMVAVTPIHMVAITKNCTVMQGCDNAVCMYIRTHKYQNSNVVCMTGAVCGSLSVRETAISVAVPKTY